ncbi:MAG: hypothetical protein ACFCD0_11135 [Gemmataceae bacterium]
MSQESTVDVAKKSNTRLIVSVVFLFLVAIGGLIGYFYVSNTAAKTNAELWVIVDASESQEVEKTIADYPQKTQGQILRMQRAWYYIDRATEALVSNPPEARQVLQGVEKDLKQLYKELEDHKLLGAQALYYRAMAQETLATYDYVIPDKNQRYLTKAKNTFESLANSDKYAESAYAKLAQKRLERYNSKEYLGAKGIDAMHLFYRDLSGAPGPGGNDFMNLPELREKLKAQMEKNLQMPKE